MTDGGFWAAIHSDDLLDYLRQAHEGEDPSLVLARIYLDCDKREEAPPIETSQEGDRD